MSSEVTLQGSLWHPTCKSFIHNEDFANASLETHRNSHKCGKRWSVGEIKLKISDTGEQWRSSSWVNEMVCRKREMLIRKTKNWKCKWGLSHAANIKKKVKTSKRRQNMLDKGSTSIYLALQKFAFLQWCLEYIHHWRQQTLESLKWGGGGGWQVLFVATLHGWVVTRSCFVLFLTSSRWDQAAIEAFVWVCLFFFSL